MRPACVRERQRRYADNAKSNQNIATQNAHGQKAMQKKPGIRHKSRRSQKAMDCPGARIMCPIAEVENNTRFGQFGREFASIGRIMKQRKWNSFPVMRKGHFGKLKNFSSNPMEFMTLSRQRIKSNGNSLYQSPSMQCGTQNCQTARTVGAPDFCQER
jgi:hypothetical protein